MDGYEVRTLHLERTCKYLSSSCTYNHNIGLIKIYKMMYANLHSRLQLLAFPRYFRLLHHKPSRRGAGDKLPC